MRLSTLFRRKSTPAAERPALLVDHGAPTVRELSDGDAKLVVRSAAPVPPGASGTPVSSVRLTATRTDEPSAEQTAQRPAGAEAAGAKAAGAKATRGTSSPAKRSSAATTSGAAAVPAPRSSAAAAETAVIRAWAREQGLSVSDRGRLPGRVLEAYRAAH